MKNLSYEERKLALIGEIEAVFAGVSREDGITLHEAQILDDCGTMEERLQARKLDTEVRWQDVPYADFRHDDAIILFLDDKGFRYYVPAYLTWYLRLMDEPYETTLMSNALDSLTYFLEGGGKRVIGESYLSRFRILNVEQSRAIAHFLQFDLEREEREFRECRTQELLEAELSADEIEQFWRKFVPEPSMWSAQRALGKYWGQFL